MRTLPCSFDYKPFFSKETKLAMEEFCFQPYNLTSLLLSLTVAVLSDKASTASTFVVVLNLGTNSKVFARIRLTHVLLCKKGWKSVELSVNYYI